LVAEEKVKSGETVPVPVTKYF